MSKIILHVDMDAFYAAVEMRDNPALKGKPLIIGGLPSEKRGVVSTCNYEAREYGIRSAMSIGEAFKRCPNGIYMHPDITKYEKESQRIHAIWHEYTDIIEYISLDEGYLDVTLSIKKSGDARTIAQSIKEKTYSRLGLTCSVGIGYCMAAAKLASEEKKPDGLYEIATPESFVALIEDRDIRVINGIGIKTTERLNRIGIYKVKDIWERKKYVIEMLGKRGEQIVSLSEGIDERSVVPYDINAIKSIAREQTFQEDTEDRVYIKQCLMQFSNDIAGRLASLGFYSKTVTVKITYKDMKTITRSRTIEPTKTSDIIYNTAVLILDSIEANAVRLAGVSVSNFTKTAAYQLSFDDIDLLL